MGLFHFFIFFPFGVVKGFQAQNLPLPCPQTLWPSCFWEPQHHDLGFQAYVSRASGILGASTFKLSTCTKPNNNKIYTRGVSLLRGYTGYRMGTLLRLPTPNSVRSLMELGGDEAHRASLAGDVQRVCSLHPLGKHGEHPLVHGR